MRSATFTLDGAILRNGLPFLEFEDAEIGVKYSYRGGGGYDWHIESIGFSVLVRDKSDLRWYRHINTINRNSKLPIQFIICRYGVRKRFANMMKGDRRFMAAAADNKYTGGFSAVKWEGPDNKPVEIWVDKDCPAGMSLEGNWSALHVSWLVKPNWWDVAGGVLQRVDDTLGLEATYFAMGNFGVDQVNCLGQSRGITED